MKQSESIATLASALAKAQLQIEPALKNAVNPHFRSHYADLASIWDACRGPLNSNGLSIVQFPCDAESGRIGLTTMLIHSSGEYISETVSVRAPKDDAQGLGSALTYLRRYCLSACVGCTSTEDDDGNAASTPVNARVVAPPRAVVESPAKAHIPATPPQVNAPPKPIAATIATLSTQMSPDKEEICEIVKYHKVDEGISKTGRPYVKHRIGWTDANNKMVYGTTFSASDGECASESLRLELPVSITYIAGQYGLDIKSVVMRQETVAAVGDNDVPF